MDQCNVCKHIRYDEDLFDETCWACSQWAQDQIVALRAEVARRKEAQEKDGAAMRMATAELSRRRLEVAALKAKLARYTEPLTLDQWAEVHQLHGPEFIRMDMDAAIRKVRGES